MHELWEDMNSVHGTRPPTKANCNKNLTCIITSALPPLFVFLLALKTLTTESALPVTIKLFLLVLKSIERIRRLLALKNSVFP